MAFSSHPVCLKRVAILGTILLMMQQVPASYMHTPQHCNFSSLIVCTGAKFMIGTHF